jgi:predicted PurR-regulated permease PerM
MTGLLGTFLSTTFNATEAMIIIIISAAYLSADPAVHREGFVRLFPPQYHEWAGETLEDIGRALRYWLLGQFIQMAIVGVLSGLTARVIGLPAPWALGLIAALAESIPFIGPILAAIPAPLVAVTRGESAVLWTLAAYLLIHQVEGNLIVPLIQRRMIFIPPALVLLGIAAMGALAGVMGFRARDADCRRQFRFCAEGLCAGCAEGAGQPARRTDVLISVLQNVFVI